MDKTQLFVDAAVVGGSLGGVQAALSLLEAGYSVYLGERSGWIGGQLTSQAVPPDEHRWIEQFGCTKRYREFRNRIRRWYEQSPGFSNTTGEASFDPGRSSVSRLAHLPRLAWTLLMEDLQPWINTGRLVLETAVVPCMAQRDKKIITSVTMQHIGKPLQRVVRAGIYIDGTDQGDLLPIIGAAYRIGAESQAETGEPSAPRNPDRSDLQPVTWVLCMKRDPEGQLLPEPPEYHDYCRLKQPYDRHAVFSHSGPDSATGKAREFGVFDEETPRGIFPLWSYRRIQHPAWYPGEEGSHPELSLLNWPQNDYWMGNIIEDPHAVRHFQQSKQLSLSFLRWLQTEAPRPGGRKGYPEISLASDVLGTDDGCAQFPYIREGRRIKAVTTIVEQDIAAACHQHLPKRLDSIGVGSYHIDVHITTSSHRFFFDHSWPFEIPLGAMIPLDVDNLIPASKNIGTTHITNGSFRLHPVEWNIGEVAGHLAAWSLKMQISPKEIHANHLGAFQDHVEHHGVELHWPADADMPI